jgi:hypothetical protein
VGVSGDLQGDAARFARGTAFQEAISKFAVADADQTEKNWNSFLAAIKAGRITAAEPKTKND